MQAQLIAGFTDAEIAIVARFLSAASERPLGPEAPSTEEATP
jgi:hypothetical protein